MATASVASPQASKPFSGAATIAANLMAPQPANLATGNPETLAGRFVLNSQAFVDLQIYVKASLMLPGSCSEFENAFPSKLFEPWFKKDVGLHEKTQDTVVGIHAHCYNFQNTTVDKMMLFADKLLKFAETEDSRFKEIMSHKATIEDDSLDLRDPALKRAIGAVWSACTSLSADAEGAERDARALMEELRRFQTDTENDALKLSDVQSRTNAALPTMQQIGEQAGQEYKELQGQLKKMYDEQITANRDNGWPNNGSLYYINSIGVVMYCKDQAMWDRLQEIDRKLKGLWSSAHESRSRAIQLSAKTGSLRNMIEQVQKTIGKAIDALKDIGNDFRDFNSELADIKTKIRNMNTSLIEDRGWIRSIAYDDLAGARAVWVVVRRAAEFYKRNGVLLKNDDKKKLDDMKVPPPRVEEGVELVGATFGTVNVTELAKAMYSRGTTIEVPGLIRDFSDPWMRVEKTFTMLYTVDRSHRAFACKEYGAKADDNYILRRDFGSSKIDAADHSYATHTIPASPKKCPIEIIAVFWGPERREKKEVISYVYGCVNNTPGIEWNNKNFGGDSWDGTQKTGVVYYRHKKGNSEIRVLIGREGEVTQLKV